MWNFFFIHLLFDHLSFSFSSLTQGCHGLLISSHFRVSDEEENAGIKIKKTITAERARSQRAREKITRTIITTR